MKNLALAAALVLLPAAAFAAPEKKAYQVTGPLLEISDSKLVVKKGNGKWEMARDANTKVPAGVKVGSKVTIHYTMTAVDMVEKGAAAPAVAPAKAGEKAAEPAKK